jgi:hypothetical protein
LILLKEGAGFSGFQSPYTPPTQIQRPPPSQIRLPSPLTQEKGPPLNPPRENQTSTIRADTPKVGGKWMHPALKGIDKEMRKLIFGEEELKKLLVNAFLLYSLWLFSSKIDDRCVLFLK